MQISSKTGKLFSVFSLTLWIFAFGVSVGYAALDNQKCTECHTMHRSQDNQVLSEWGAGGPYTALMVTSCAGCHTGTNQPGSMPYVMSSVAPLYGVTGTESNTNTLAGGSFYWVGDSASRGHNVYGIASADPNLPLPPGFNGQDKAIDDSSPGGGIWLSGTQVTCAGIYGCHGTHAVEVESTAIRGGHHHGLENAITTASSEPGESYRMLLGVVGYEDPEWELTPTATAHNQYKGVSLARDKTTISALCTRCHGDFHSEAGSATEGWTPHPVDYDMSDTALDSEYRLYGGETNLYQVAVPLASTQVTAPKEFVLQGGDSIITCVSCHRAHGSPFEKLLRWDYSGSPGSGCVYCHTSKS
ncbi:cytochrome c3 family protein [Malonomonas rubra]|uniref:cytochrome c3 family protein n=1 Tax=Malonomonas rubra TaxID=57040 RepID=UPI0026F15441|nr:cytochrome c3 family protein [Malonomonas rubra]